MAVLIAGMQGTSLKGLATANSVKNAGKGSSGSDFGAMLTSNISKQDSSQSSTPQAKSEPVTKQDGVSSTRKEKDSDATPAVKPLEKTTSQASQTEESSKMEDGLQAEELEEISAGLEAEGTEAIFTTLEADGLEAAVKEILTEIKSAVKDVLQLNEEELSLLMEQMGIVMADFLDPQVLQQFVVEASGGEDISALLADESMYSDLKQLQELIGNIVQDSGISKEEIVQQAAQRKDVEVDEFSGKKAVHFEAKDQNVENPAAVFEAEEDTFHFEVVRESGEDARQESSSQNRNSGTQVSPSEQFLNLVTNAVSENQEEAEVEFSQLSAAEQLREIADQILEKVRVIINPAQTSMEITLNPESLGRVSLNLISKQGVMTAQFTAQNQVAREAIESQITVLRENLENQGLKVEAIEVTISNFEFTQSDGMAGQEQQGGRPQQRRNLHIEETGFLDEVTEEEALAIDILERSGNSVDYTA